MATTPTILVFDVNETLIDITTIEPLFERLFGDRRVMREWFAQLVLYSQATTIAGAYTPFGALGAGVLRMLGAIHGIAIDDADVAELSERVGSMPALPDAAAALRRLSDAGFRLVTLTNSAPPADGPTPLERAGLAPFFERSFSVHEVRRAKPAPETYRMVAEALGVEMDALCLVAAHAWDTIGAEGAGCAAALVMSPGNAPLDVENVPQPQIVAPTLTAVAEAIIARWRPT